MLNAINHTNRSDSWVNCQTPNYITNWIHLANNFSEINWTWGAWISIKLTDFTLYSDSETPRFNQNTMKSRERIFISWLFFLSPPKIFHDVDFGLSNGFGHLLFLTKYLYEIAQSHMLKYKNTKSTTKKTVSSRFLFCSTARLKQTKRPKLFLVSTGLENTYGCAYWQTYTNFEPTFCASRSVEFLTHMYIYDFRSLVRFFSVWIFAAPTFHVIVYLCQVKNAIYWVEWNDLSIMRNVWTEWTNEHERQHDFTLAITESTTVHMKNELFSIRLLLLSKIATYSYVS